MRALAALAVFAATAAAQANVMTITPLKLRPDAYVLSGFANGNVLALTNDSEVVLIDAQSSRRAPYLDSALKSLGITAPVKLVIDTHYHTDHVGGNGYWRARGAAVLAETTLKAHALRDTTTADFGGWHHFPEPAENLPTLEIGKDTTLWAADRRVEIILLSRAHTGSDIAVWIPAENIVHTGDILEVGAPPFIDYGAGGSLTGMIGGLDRIIALVNDSTSIVPGHGRVVARQFLIAYRDVLAAANASLKKAIAGGASEAAFADAARAREMEDLFGGADGATGFLRMIFRGEATRK